MSPLTCTPSDSLSNGSHTVNSPKGEELPAKELPCQFQSSLLRLCPTQLDSNVLRDPETESSSQAHHSFLALRNCIINVSWCVCVGGYTPVIIVLQRLSQEDLKFEANLGYSM